MCWVCDHPNASRQDWLDHLREMLDEQCWVLIAVRRDRYRPPFSYTVGLTGHGKPEIVVYADDRGRWPWDQGVRGGRGGQPVLGARAAARVG
jgi:Domain of unknown function (DUF4262)